MWAQFKEKTYETAFVGELRLYTNRIYAPDQCDEEFLGFDAAALIPWDELWQFAPHVRWRRWRHFIGLPTSELNHIGKVLDSLPPFRLNLFAQFKRPQFLSHYTAAEWEEWNTSYYRYFAPAGQQELLQRIIDKSAGRAVVVYAAPAFHTKKDFFTHLENDDIIPNSNVASAERLKGHTRFTYTQAGHVGVGHSDPERLESPTLQEMLAGNADTVERPFTQHMKDTAALIKSLFDDDVEGREILNLARRAIMRGALEDTSPRASGTWLDAILTMVAFSTAFEVKVCAIA